MTITNFTSGVLVARQLSPSPPGFAATSGTSLLIGTGDRTFATQIGMAYRPGQYIRLVSRADPVNYMEGQITAYAGSSMTVSVARVGPTAAGTFSDWDIVVAGTPGAGNMSSDLNLGDVANKTLARANIGLGGHSFCPMIAYQHFDPTSLHGAGWNSTAPETGGLVTYTAAAGAAVGDRALTLSAAPSFVADQLIVCRGADGQYYGAVVKSISGAIVTLKHPLPAAITSGNLVSNFWNDEDHPNRYGYYLMVDAALRNSRRKYRLAHKWTAADPYRSSGSPTISALSALSYNNPGSTISPARYCIGSAGNDGIVLPRVNLSGGSYIVRVTMTANTEAASADSAATYVFITDDTGVDVGFAGSSSRCAEYLDIPIFARSGHSVFVQLAVGGAGVGFAVSQIEFFEQSESVADINFGRHVVIGDSYIAQPYFADYLATRLPKATVMSVGVSGNTTAQMAARFVGDVGSKSPDFVWIVAEGANDRAGASVPANVYEANVANMIGMVANLGAETIVLNSGVGTLAHSAGYDTLTRSREYALSTRLGYQYPVGTWPTTTVRVPIIKTIANGSTSTVFIAPSLTRKGLTIKDIYLDGGYDGASGIVFGYGGVPGITSEDTGALPLREILNDITVPKAANASNRFFSINVVNASGADAEIKGYVSIEYEPASG